MSKVSKHFKQTVKKSTLKKPNQDVSPEKPLEPEMTLSDQMLAEANIGTKQPTNQLQQTLQ